MLREEAKKQNIEEDVINYIDKVLEEYEEEKTSNVDETKSEVFSNEDIVTSEDVPKLDEKESIPTVEDSKDVQKEKKLNLKLIHPQVEKKQTK